MNAVCGTKFSVLGCKCNHLMYKTQIKICRSYEKLRDKKERKMRIEFEWREIRNENGVLS